MDRITLTSQSLRALNANHSKTRHLPAEVLALIFQFACDGCLSAQLDALSGTTPRFRERVSPVLIGSVCALWHEIVHSTPQLWTTIHLKSNPPNEPLQNQVDLVTYALEKSRDQPLSISLQIPVAADDIEDTVDTSLVAPKVRRLYSAPIDPHLMRNISRIRELHIMGRVVGWMDALTLHSFDKLEFLSIEGDTTLQDDVDLCKCPNLRQLRCVMRVTSYLKPIIHFAQTSVPNLTHVYLANTPARSALDILIQCRNLVIFDARGVTWSYEEHLSHGRDYDRDLPKNTHTLEHLKVFGCDLSPWWGWNYWHEMLVKYLVLPSLEELIWYCGGPRSAVDSRTPQFFTRLPPTVRVIHLRGHSEKESFHPSQIQVFPSNLIGLEEITLDPATDRGLYRILRHIAEPVHSKALAPTHQNHDHDHNHDHHNHHDHPPFPDLRKLKLYGKKPFGFERGSYMSDIPEWLEKRVEKTGVDLVLEVVDQLDDRIIWQTEAKEKLEGLRPRLDVRIAGKSVSWMDL